MTHRELAVLEALNIASARYWHTHGLSDFWAPASLVYAVLNDGTDDRFVNLDTGCTHGTIFDLGTVHKVAAALREMAGPRFFGTRLPLVASDESKPKLWQVTYEGLRAMGA